MKKILLAIIAFYKKAVSPYLPRACRFFPSCSDYSAQAIEKYGAARGSWMAVKRIARCGPWSKGGMDPLK